MSEETALFVNQTSPDKKLYAQVYLSLLFKKKWGPWIYGGILLLLLGIVLVPRLVSGEPLLDDTNLLAFLLLIFTLGLLLFARFGFPSILAGKIMQKQNAAAHGEPVLLTTSFYPDRVLFHSSIGEKQSEFEYSEFLRLTETEDLFLVQTVKRQTLLFAKDGFSTGEPDAFRTFLKARI